MSPMTEKYLTFFKNADHPDIFLRNYELELPVKKFLKRNNSPSQVPISTGLYGHLSQIKIL